MDIVSSDLLMSFFVSALNSYKFDSLLRPFPSAFLNDNNEKDFQLLKAAVEEMVPFHEINWRNTENLTPNSLQLIEWVIKPKRFKLRKILTEKFSFIEKLCGETEEIGIAKPDYIFEITYTQLEEEKFKHICAGNDIIYAYHGSRAENFHSILHNGLRNNLNKVSLFGEGIYLSSDLRVCQTYSPTGCGWQHSLLGESLSCIAVCQVVDHPDVKCSVKHSSLPDFAVEVKNTNTGQQPRKRLVSESSTVTDVEYDPEVKTARTNQSRSRIRGSEGGHIPDKYYVIRNDDLVRIKYLYVYAPNAQRELIRQLLSGRSVNQNRNRTGYARHFLQRYKFFLVMLLYVLALCCISIFNSRAFSNWWQNMVKNTDDDSVFLPK